MKHAALMFAILVSSGCASQFPETSSWDPGKATFRWWAGEVSLPHGYSYQRLSSDSDYGEFTSLNGKPTMWHDIGGHAGIWAQRKDAIAFSETTIDGARVWVAVDERSSPDGTYYLVAVSFPDSGPANFYLNTKHPERDAAIIHRIAASFRPGSR